MARIFKYILSIYILLNFSSCEEQIDLDIPIGEPKVVVYGIIENDLLPYVILTNSLNYFATIDSLAVAESFIEGADVTYSVDGNDYKMIQFNITQNNFNIVAYFPAPTDTLVFFGTEIPTWEPLQFGEIGKSYDLKIELDGEVYTATTTIPDTLSLTDYNFAENPDPSKDSLVSLFSTYSDPSEPGNFARLFTKVNNEQFIPDRFQSVYSDELINGGTWDDFVVPKGEDPNTEMDLETYSYFNRGDTVTVKWVSIDKAHYDYWITLETDRNNSGNPFGRPTIVKSNIEGGLGIWGGYAATYKTLYAPE